MTDLLFLEAAQQLVSPRAVVWGCGVEAGISFRKGTAQGPTGIREFSQSIESFSPRQRKDLRDIALLDAGDNPDPSFAAPLLSMNPSALLATFGGDHSITPKLVSAVRERHVDLVVIGFDAHLDMREDYPGDHACTYRRIGDAGVECHVFGPRSGDRQEYEDAPKVLTSLHDSVAIPVGFVDGLGSRSVYVTLDIDVLDPSVAPGTGNPEPGGPAFNDLLESIASLKDVNVVGFDIVEVSPPLDPSGITQAAAAVLAREMLLYWTKGDAG